jgi:hypothetical protein
MAETTLCRLGERSDMEPGPAPGSPKRLNTSVSLWCLHSDDARREILASYSSPLDVMNPERFQIDSIAEVPLGTVSNALLSALLR